MLKSLIQRQYLIIQVMVLMLVLSELMGKLLQLVQKIKKFEIRDE